jgi:hypothetical protein
MMKSAFYFSGALCVFASTILAGGVETISVPDPTLPQPKQRIVFCPPINALVKNPETRTWSSPYGWKSYEMSFEDKLTEFSGAQWRGTNVGQIFCVYRAESPTAFPVLLAYNVLAFTPQGGKWSENLGGYENCESSNPQDCPFTIRIKQEKEDLYEQAERLKRPATTSNKPGF